MSERRIGVYVCNCGGNISDHVDVERVVAAVQDEPGVVVARRAMFTCSDSTQQEIIDDIQGQELDGLVVASCSPKLHTFTFRAVAQRAGLNPYEYTQVNVREQCSWTHTDDPDGATRKAIALVRAGIARTRLTEPLEPIVVETTPRALVVGGGIAGMRAAIGLADVGLAVFLVERESKLGGHVGEPGRAVSARQGRARADRAARRADSPTAGDHGVHERRAEGEGGHLRQLPRRRARGRRVDPPRGGADRRRHRLRQLPAAGGRPRLRDRRRADARGVEATARPGEGPLVVAGRPVESVAYVYCVGSRDAERPYCSRFCCSAAVHASLSAAGRDAHIRQYHLYRDLRTYGRNELMLNESRERGSLYLKFADDDPPEVARADDGLLVTVRDQLTGGEELTVPVDVVVLVTGMVPRENGALVGALKIPIGRDGFFNEIHPKLRPVETVVDGVLIAGACQGPKTSAESVASGLAAVTQAAAVLKRGVAELDPQVAVVHTHACTGCGECMETCPFGAISLVAQNGGEVAVSTPPAARAVAPAHRSVRRARSTARATPTHRCAR